MLICSQTLFAQRWVDLMMEPDANYYNIQRAFYQEWGDKPYERGKGWKQFHRWEAFWENRIMEDGTFPMYNKVWEDFKSHLTSGSNKSGGIGNWSPIGPFSINNTDSWSPGTGRVNCVWKTLTTLTPFT